MRWSKDAEITICAVAVAVAAASIIFALSEGVDGEQRIVDALRAERDEARHVARELQYENDILRQIIDNEVDRIASCLQQH